MLVACAPLSRWRRALPFALETTVWPGPGQPGGAGDRAGPTGLAFLAWDHATKHGDLPLLGSLSYLAPLLSTLLLVAAGKAASPVALMLAAVLVIAGAMVGAGLPWVRRR